jgi:peptide-methionine (S)-S-oxide reductase
MIFGTHKSDLPTPDKALPGGPEKVPVPTEHFVKLHPLAGPFPEGHETAVFAMGCFWGAERAFWEADGVYTTAVGYEGGYTPNPSYQEVCSGRTGHTEAVLVVFDPAVITYEDVLRIFWENHDPTQGMRQGNDRGTQYRSAIYTTTPEQAAAAERSKVAYQKVLDDNDYGAITTEIAAVTDAAPSGPPAETGQAGPFFYAEGYHQQYLAKNPGGYCGLGGTGIACPVGLVSAED